jgi:hypothetical protein
MPTRAQMPPKSPPTIVESFVGDRAGLRVTGVFDVSIRIPQRRSHYDRLRDPWRELERVIAKGIRSALREYAREAK